VHPGSRVVELTENYRSTPEILAVANRLLWSAGRPKRLQATREGGPAPTIARHATDEAEIAWLVGRIRTLAAEGTPLDEIAVLVRTNAQLEPVESALTRAGIAFRVRGVAFFRRPDVRAAIDVVRRSKAASSLTGVALRAEVRAAWTSELGFEDDAGERGAEARERAAAMATLAGILDDLVGASASLSREELLAAFAGRAADEDAAGAADVGGVELATYHRAKGLEWDAVFLPMLEDGSLPIRQALDDEEALEEERRLLYVGITRARVHLALSWAERRGGARRPSRFLAGLGDRGGTAAARPTSPRSLPGSSSRSQGALPDTPHIAALRAWRTLRARTDDVPAFVIAHDATLRAIADARPTTLAALGRVKGMGPTKLDRYGPEILAALEGVTAND
jgi:DNA helicase-2/ATP-dependent DNA helicase PcrA